MSQPPPPLPDRGRGQSPPARPGPARPGAHGAPPRPGAATIRPAAGRTGGRGPRRSRRTLWIVAAAIAVVALAVGGVAVGAALSDRTPAASATTSPSATTPATPPPATAPATPPPATVAPAEDSARTALRQLAGLRIVSGRSDARYDRALFGQAWYDVDRNGCDTRNDILGRDLLDPVFKPGTRDCKVLRGILIDPYDGRRVSFVSGQNTSVLVQIDHVVPLAWAWRHGAEHWTDDTRLRFANDPRNLAASSEDMNQEKGASGPGEWLPPVAELRCDYVERWADVLDAYDLGINRDDLAAAEAVLRRC